MKQKKKKKGAVKLPQIKERSPKVMTHQELIRKCNEFQNRIRKLEQLIEIISRGKYQWEATFDAITSPVMIVSDNYKIERANINLATVCGEDITKVVGKKCYEILAKSNSPCENCPMKSAIKEDSPFEDMVKMKKMNKEYAVSSYPYILEGFGTSAAVMYYRDVTEEKRLQRETIQQEKMAAIGLLAGGVAHEINSPLGGILALSQILLRDTPEEEQIYKDLKEIESAAIRCKKIVADLLDFSRVSRDEEMRRVDLNDLVESVIRFAKNDLQKQSIELIIELEKKGVDVECYPDRIQQVFLNLVTNALHAMNNGGRLIVKTGKSKENILLSVTDTGCGIPEEIIDRIFEPFFTTKDAGIGTGLGLSIAYRIVKDHCGEIKVESEVGKGTTFCIYLPITND